MRISMPTGGRGFPEKAVKERTLSGIGGTGGRPRFHEDLRTWPLTTFLVASTETGLSSIEASAGAGKGAIVGYIVCRLYGYTAGSERH